MSFKRHEYNARKMPLDVTHANSLLMLKSDETPRHSLDRENSLLLSKGRRTSQLHNPGHTVYEHGKTSRYLLPTTAEEDGRRKSQKVSFSSQVDILSDRTLPVSHLPLKSAKSRTFEAATESALTALPDIRLNTLDADVRNQSSHPSSLMKPLPPIPRENGTRSMLYRRSSALKKLGSLLQRPARQTARRPDSRVGPDHQADLPKPLDTEKATPPPAPSTKLTLKPAHRSQDLFFTLDSAVFDNGGDDYTPTLRRHVEIVHPRPRSSHANGRLATDLATGGLQLPDGTERKEQAKVKRADSPLESPGDATYRIDLELDKVNNRTKHNHHETPRKSLPTVTRAEVLQRRRSKPVTPTADIIHSQARGVLLRRSATSPHLTDTLHEAVHDRRNELGLQTHNRYVAQRSATAPPGPIYPPRSDSLRSNNFSIQSGSPIATLQSGSPSATVQSGSLSDTSSPSKSSPPSTPASFYSCRSLDLPSEIAASPATTCEGAHDESLHHFPRDTLTLETQEMASRTMQHELDKMVEPALGECDKLSGQVIHVSIARQVSVSRPDRQVALVCKEFLRPRVIDFGKQAQDNPVAAVQHG